MKVRAVLTRHIVLVEELVYVSWSDELLIEVDGCVCIAAIHEEPFPSQLLTQDARVALGAALCAKLRQGGWWHGAAMNQPWFTIEGERLACKKSQARVCSVPCLTTATSLTKESIFVRKRPAPQVGKPQPIIPPRSTC